MTIFFYLHKTWIFIKQIVGVGTNQLYIDAANAAAVSANLEFSEYHLSLCRGFSRILSPLNRLILSESSSSYCPLVALISLFLTIKRCECDWLATIDGCKYAPLCSYKRRLQSHELMRGQLRDTTRDIAGMFWIWIFFKETNFMIIGW